jgi:hypothetical protein
MTEPQLDRRLQDWLTAREPGPVPPTLRESAGRVAFETSLPATWRVWGAIVSPAGSTGVGRNAPLALVLLVLGLIAAAAVAVVVGASRTPLPVPGLAGWGSFVVGRPAPAIVMRNVAGTPAVGDDSTFEFEDRVGSVVVVYVPSRGGGDSESDVATLVTSRSRAAAGVGFLVATDAPSADRPAVTAAAAGGIGAVELPPGWAGRSDRLPGVGLIVIDRHGTVAAVFGGALPGPDQLSDIISREVTP